MRNFIHWLAAMTLLFSGCKGDHLIINSDYRHKVESDFNEREILAAARASELFSPFSKDISVQQTEALQFLYAYMPLSDLADYTGNFFLANADIALKTREKTGFTKDIPEDIFLHYVLPIRVNNENLDSFRIIYAHELSERIKGLEALNAALEINYWCHEKVAYQPADIRTSGPVSTILSARGRCGEESTFAVAALRAAGIPARQVYTPRWAHSDDNHAWVEFWADGKWYYMGACEPEAVPDRGWFTEPARRAMLVHTRSFGAPTGEENTIISTRNFSMINSLSKYAVTKRLAVKVLDGGNNPAKGASVEFQLYNYAEFYPLAVIPTDDNGVSTFETGLGDLMIWAYKGDRFGFRKVSVSEIDTVEIRLGSVPPEPAFIEYDLGVPLSRAPFKGPDEELVRANSERVINGNNIRKAYIETWMKPEDAISLSKETGTDSVVVKDIIRRSMGNFRAISSFIRNTPEEDRSLALILLNTIADKDLRDTPEPVLRDHLENTLRFGNLENKYTKDIWISYVLNPRIANEIIVPWRKYLFDSIPPVQRQEMINNPEAVEGYVMSEIKLMNEENYYKVPVTPKGVGKLKLSDSFSRDIYYVAVCRSLGIPSRLEPGTNRPQFYSSGTWNDVWFGAGNTTAAGKGYIKLSSDEISPVPEYYIHFTISRFKNGRYNTLEYDFNKRISSFSEELGLDPGFYMLMTGNRVSDSRILTSLTFFELKENEHRTLTVKLRKDNAPQEILGKIRLSERITLAGGRSQSLTDFSKKGIVLTWLEPDKEPTRHIFNDLPLLKKELDSWGGTFVFFTDPSKPGSDIDPSVLPGLPANSIFAVDNGSTFLSSVCGGVSCSTVRLPLMILTDNEGNILLRSEGYRIGIGEQILKKTKK